MGYGEVVVLWILVVWSGASWCCICWSALIWVVYEGWLVRGGILRVAQNDKGDSCGFWRTVVALCTVQNDKGDRGGFPASFLLATY
jgi:hypothetical protein